MHPPTLQHPASYIQLPRISTALGGDGPLSCRRLSGQEFGLQLDAQQVPTAGIMAGLMGNTRATATIF